VFEHSGVRVYRFDSKRCDKNPDAVVEEFLELLSKS
jgi:very-short-patch-repair endonuclease